MLAFNVEVRNTKWYTKKERECFPAKLQGKTLLTFFQIAKGILEQKMFKFMRLD